MLSIIVPIYRSEATLDRCLQSLLRQNIADYEVILVDDGSPDGCPQLCDDWAANDSHFHVIHKQNGGLSMPTTRCPTIPTSSSCAMPPPTAT